MIVGHYQRMSPKTNCIPENLTWVDIDVRKTPYSDLPHIDDPLSRIQKQHQKRFLLEMAHVPSDVGNHIGWLSQGCHVSGLVLGGPPGEIESGGQ